ncbi:sugar phosphate isomerase/epimerase family protein [Marisediminicola sp. LYQ85]|uniref:sugar phosphate isomerase/epimerase family protein n=1 Tax=Marisediminicola sp. LYQ85 TaxID=3391062 RepID=UPI0039839557
MITVGMSTSSVYPLSTEGAFRLAATAGYDGVEVMITSDPSTRSVDTLRTLSDRYGMRVLSVHAPVLLLSQLVWGRDPVGKLERSADLAAQLGAPVVVAHPPFRWQRSFASRFAEIVRATAERSGVSIAVENMFPITTRGITVDAFAPGWDPTLMDVDAMTLDFSHAASAGLDSLDIARNMGPRLRHVHLCDGITSGRHVDEHLRPGDGDQPVAAVLERLAGLGWSGSVVAEINTRAARSEARRLEMLGVTLDFARRALSAGSSSARSSSAPPASAGSASARPARRTPAREVPASTERSLPRS